MDQNTEHLLALIGAVTTAATLAQPLLHWIAERTATPYDDEVVRLIDRLLQATGRLGWRKPK